jgi:DNA-binding transcriptional MerR regulator/methylmalonyl-CoA mutase cobalamin-binding subunit
MTDEPMLTIAAVEREVGLSKDVLRVWERRYGFPEPGRDAHGERLYPPSQVERLRLIKRLMDQGHRPGRLLAMRSEELHALARQGGRPGRTVAAAAPAPPEVEVELAAWIRLLRDHRAAELMARLHHALARQGLMHFVQDTAAPLAAAVGTAWEDGELQVHEEHLFTELLQRVLRQAIASVPVGLAPRVLFTTPPGEPHTLGMLMAEAALALEGAHCIPMGPQMPIGDTARAARAHGADVVALSFSAAYPQRQVGAVLAQLRAALSPEVALWAGGAGAQRVPAPEGSELVSTFEQVAAAVAHWRVRHAKA